MFISDGAKSVGRCLPFCGHDSTPLELLASRYGLDLRYPRKDERRGHSHINRHCNKFKKLIILAVHHETDPALAVFGSRESVPWSSGSILKYFSKTEGS